MLMNRSGEEKSLFRQRVSFLGWSDFSLSPGCLWMRSFRLPFKFVLSKDCRQGQPRRKGNGIQWPGVWQNRKQPRVFSERKAQNLHMKCCGEKFFGALSHHGKSRELCFHHKNKNVLTKKLFELKINAAKLIVFEINVRETRRRIISKFFGFSHSLLVDRFKYNLKMRSKMAETKTNAR